MSVPSNQHVIVVGGGLSGLSACHTIIQRGGNVLLLDKNPFLGGNSTKATSGINGSLTKAQIALGIKDSVDTFAKDTALSATKMKSDKPTELGLVLTGESGPAVEWLMKYFNLDLSLVSQLGGHSFPRTHRGPEKFPGMTITYALMEALEKIEHQTQGRRGRIITGANVKKLIKEGDAVVGVEYEVEGGEVKKAHGPVVLATGGYGADFTKDGILAKYRPDLLEYATTNGDHCTGDGLKLAYSVGGSSVDLEAVQVHPTGLVDPKDPDAKVKFLAAEALRGVGGLLLDGNGNRFVNELATRDYVSEVMGKNKGPFRLVLNGKASKEIEWHCKHYLGRGLMKKFDGAGLAKEIGISSDKLKKTFDDYNKVAETKNDPFGKKYFQNLPFTMDDHYHVAWVMPLVHYCMGGVRISPKGECTTEDGKVIDGLFACGEVTGAVHGLNRLGGSSLTECVVFGRVSGGTAAEYFMQHLLTKPQQQQQQQTGAVSHQFNQPNGSVLVSFKQVDARLTVSPSQNGFNVQVNWDGAQTAGGQTAVGGQVQAGELSGNAIGGKVDGGPDNTDKSYDPNVLYNNQDVPAVKAGQDGAKAGEEPKTGTTLKPYTLEDVAKHNTATDCWVVVNGKVLDCTKFMKRHPGGAKAIMLYAGKDATEEFNMLHDENVIEKYAPETVIGTLAARVTEATPYLKEKPESEQTPYNTKKHTSKL